MTCQPGYLPCLTPAHARREGWRETGGQVPHDGVFGHWLPFPNVFATTSAQGLLAAHPAAQALRAQAGFVGTLVPGLLSAQVLALGRRLLARPGVDLDSKSRSAPPGLGSCGPVASLRGAEIWELSPGRGREGTSRCRCYSRGSAWASPLVPRESLLLERLQSCVPGRGSTGTQAVPCPVRVQRMGCSGRSETESKSCRFHCQGQEFPRGAARAPLPQPGLRVYDINLPPQLTHPKSAAWTSLERSFSRTPIPCGLQWECPSPEFSASPGPRPFRPPVYDPSGVSFRKKRRVRTPGSGPCPPLTF